MKKENKIIKRIKRLGFGAAMMAATMSPSLTAEASEEENNISIESQLLDENEQDNAALEMTVNEENVSEEPKDVVETVISEQSQVSSNIVNENNISFEDTYDTLEEALDNQEKKEEEFQDAGYTDIESNITEESKEISVKEEVLVGTETQTENGAYTDLTKEEAEAKKEEIEYQDKDKTVTGDIYEYQEDTGIDDEFVKNEEYDTKEEAEEAEDKITSELEEEGYKDIEATIDEKHEEVKVGEEEIKKSEETTKEEYKELTKEEAEELKELETDTKEQTITVTIDAYQHDTGVDDIQNISKTFTSEKEFNEYIVELQNQGYTLSNISLKANTKMNDVTLNETYDDIEEAQKKLKDFLDTYQNADGKITEVRNEEKDSTTDDQEKFDTLEEAQEAEKKLKEENKDNIVETEIVENRAQIDDLRDEITKTFESEEEAEKYIKELEDSGYELVSNIVKEEVEYIPILPEINNGTTTGEEITAKNRANLFIRLDGDVQYENGTTSYPDDYYVFAGSVGVKQDIVYDIDANNHGNDLTYLINNNNKIGEKVIATISENEINNFLSNYGIKLNDDQVIVWYVLKNQVDAVRDRIYKNADGDKIVIKTDACAYHIDGVIRSKKALKNIYSINGTGSKNDGYYLNSSITTLGYDYVVEASGKEEVLTGTYSGSLVASKDIYETLYNATVTTTKRTYEMVPIYEDKTTYELDVKASKDVYETKYGINVTTVKNIYETREVSKEVPCYKLVVTAKIPTKENPTENPVTNPSDDVEKNTTIEQTNDIVTIIDDLEIPKSDEIPEELITIEEVDVPTSQTIEQGIPKMGDYDNSVALYLLLTSLSGAGALAVEVEKKKEKVKTLKK